MVAAFHLPRTTLSGPLHYYGFVPSGLLGFWARLLWVLSILLLLYYAYIIF